MSHSRSRFLMVAVSSAVLAVASAVPAAAQAVIGEPNNDQVLSGTTDTTPTSRRGDFAGLPGVDLSDGAGKVRVRGPGGLQNNIGAIGMATPSTSSENPLPLQNDRATTGGAIAITR